MKALLISFFFLLGMGTGALTSCKYLEPAVMAAGDSVIDTALVEGRITPEEAIQLREAMQGGDWWELLLSIGAVILGVGTPVNMAVTRAWRGSVNDRKGKPPKDT